MYRRTEVWWTYER